MFLELNAKMESSMTLNYFMKRNNFLTRIKNISWQHGGLGIQFCRELGIYLSRAMNAKNIIINVTKQKLSRMMQNGTTDLA